MQREVVVEVMVGADILSICCDMLSAPVLLEDMFLTRQRILVSVVGLK